jgi:hypothetical protein
MCDGCGKEIAGNPNLIFSEKANRESGDFTVEGPTYAPKKDFCDECMERIKNFIETMGEKAIIIPKEESEPAAEPQPFSFDDSGMGKYTEPESEPEPKKKPTVKELILKGFGKKEVVEQTGCSPSTYSQVKYTLKKQGLLPEQKCKAVKCSKVHNSCKYASGRNNECDYILITGHMRECPAEECTVYEKK